MKRVVYLAATQQDATAAASFGYTLARMTRRLGENQGGKGELLVYSHTGDGVEPAGAAGIITECSQRGYGGLALDFEGGRELLPLARELSALCAANGLPLIVNRRYGMAGAITLVSSAQVSGSIRQRLSGCEPSYSMLEIERLAQDITLPSPQGRGVTMTQSQLSQLLQSRTTFFSNELLAHYFTYKDTSGATHFVIYDDAVSISRKLTLAQSMGFYGAIMLYSEVKDIIRDIYTTIS